MPDVDCPTVVLQVKDAVGHRASLRILRKVMGIHHFGLLTSALPVVLEVANQLFFLGIDTDHRLSHRLMCCTLRMQVPKLLVSLQMLLAGMLLDVGTQAVAMGVQQAADDRLADEMATLVQLLANIAQAAVEPLLVTHRVARSLRRNDVEQDTYEGRIFFSARGRPPLGRRWRVGGWSTSLTVVQSQAI